MTSVRLAAAWGLLAAVTAIAIGCGSTSSTAGGADGGNPPGCPATIPNATLSCAAAGLQCTYGCDAFATCSGGTWTVTESNITCAADSGAASDGAACEWACPSGDDGGVCTCEGNTTPACPASASESAPCNSSGGCMGCYQGAGFDCSCSAGDSGADGGGPAWTCVGTEHACTGGTS